MSKLNCWKTACAVCVLGAATAITSLAQTFTNLANFNGINGSVPYYSGPIQGADGNFYGTTADGGADGQGTFFKLAPEGRLTTLFSFPYSNDSAPEGINPAGDLVLGPSGDFYGTAFGGGTRFDGTVFSITPRGVLTLLHSFDGTDGSTPFGTLVLGVDGNFYGTTALGGTNDSCDDGYGCGTVFKISPGGAFTSVYSFCSQTNCADGELPYAGVIQGADGNFYGTTTGGGANGYGTVFKLTPEGTLTTLHSFDYYPDGAVPYAALIQAGGYFYGTTSVGGGNGGYGTIFRINSAGTLTTLHKFTLTDGAYPDAALIQASDGNFYGTTSAGGAYTMYGTVFEFSAGGVLTTLHSFDNADGSEPLGALFQATDGSFYGATPYGGPEGYGTVFSLATGLGPFVSPVPGFGTVGTSITILGNNLTGATSVTFNGDFATFTVSPSGTAIRAVVPFGATTGKVQVVTPSGTLTSNANFRVLP